MPHLLFNFVSNFPLSGVFEKREDVITDPRLMSEGARVCEYEGEKKVQKETRKSIFFACMQ